MKKNLSIIILLAFNLCAFSQSFDPAIDSLINQVNQDSLVAYVSILSGEDSVFINGQKQLINQRIYNSNDLSQQYISQKLASFGLTPEEEKYSTNGTNILAIQQGSEYPDEYYMICAHYDAVTYYAADDNASGTATVLEAARILSNVEFPYSIIYALWDEEEIGLVGSNFYAQNARAENMNIGGVINIDMIGWDGDNDAEVEIHSNFNTQSEAIVEVMEDINTNYGVGLIVNEIKPGTTASDHASFWQNSYGAVLLIEEYYGGDFNPYYHTPSDRISEFNIPYFHKSAKLAIGSVAEMATQEQYVSVTQQSKPDNAFRINNYPNPFKGQTTIEYILEEEVFVNIFIVSSYGQIIKTIANSKQDKGTYSINFSAYNLPTGIYSIILNSGNVQLSRKMMVVK